MPFYTAVLQVISFLLVFLPEIRVDILIFSWTSALGVTKFPTRRNWICPQFLCECMSEHGAHFQRICQLYSLHKANRHKLQSSWRHVTVCSLYPSRSCIASTRSLSSFLKPQQHNIVSWLLQLESGASVVIVAIPSEMRSKFGRNLSSGCAADTGGQSGGGGEKPTRSRPAGGRR
jgi:hypothetical protein